MFRVYPRKNQSIRAGEKIVIFIYYGKIKVPVSWEKSRGKYSSILKPFAQAVTLLNLQLVQQPSGVL